MSDTGRNEPCPCGSGKKYKKCCLKNEQTVRWGDNSNLHKIIRTGDLLLAHLGVYFRSFYGNDAIKFAWDEFTLWDDWPLDLESDLEPLFIPWFVFNWIPDNAGIEINFEETPGVDPSSERYEIPEIAIANHYLEKKQFILDAFEKDFIEANLKEELSFFLVTDIAPGITMTVKDLLQDKTATVNERSGPSGFTKGSIFFGRVVTVNSDSVLLGSSKLDLTTRMLPQILDFRDFLLKGNNEITPYVLHEYDTEIRTLFFSLRDEIQDPNPPTLVNSDGELLQFHNLKFELNCSFEEAVELLAPLALEDDVKNLLANVSVTENNNGEEVKSLEIPWFKAGNKMHSHWDHTVLGQIWVEDGFMNIEANSDKRAEEIKGIIKKRFGKKAVFVAGKAIDFDKNLEEMNTATQKENIEDRRAEHEALMELPEVREKIDEMAANHWQEWLDKELPGLAGESPRKACKTKKGKELLEGILLGFESGKEMLGDASGAFKPDVEWIRRELGSS